MWTYQFNHLNLSQFYKYWFNLVWVEFQLQFDNPKFMAIILRILASSSQKKKTFNAFLENLWTSTQLYIYIKVQKYNHNANLKNTKTPQTKKIQNYPQTLKREEKKTRIILN